MVLGGRGLWIQEEGDYSFSREGIMDSGERGL